MLGVMSDQKSACEALGGSCFAASMREEAAAVHGQATSAVNPTLVRPFSGA